MLIHHHLVSSQTFKHLQSSMEYHLNPQCQEDDENTQEI
jgi:hypothetical protein